MIWKVINNFLILLYKEVKGILLYQWFPSPILPTKQQNRREVSFVGNISGHLHYTFECDYFDGEISCSFKLNYLF